MSAAHTPGPWVVRTIDESIGSIDSADGSVMVAQALQVRAGRDASQHDERRANARLIAAAPELLEMLRKVYDHLYERQDCDLRGEDWVPNEALQILTELGPQMEAAIEKATQPARDATA